MLKIKRLQLDNFAYYECTFLGGNLYAFTIKDMINQLSSIYGFNLSLFNFNLN